MIWTKDLKSLNNSLDIRMTIKTKVERIKNINGNLFVYVFRESIKVYDCKTFKLKADLSLPFIRKKPLIDILDNEVLIYMAAEKLYFYKINIEEKKFEFMLYLSNICDFIYLQKRKEIFLLTRKYCEDGPISYGMARTNLMGNIILSINITPKISYEFVAPEEINNFDFPTHVISKSENFGLSYGLLNDKYIINIYGYCDDWYDYKINFGLTEVESTINIYRVDDLKEILDEQHLKYLDFLKIGDNLFKFKRKEIFFFYNEKENKIEYINNILNYLNNVKDEKLNKQYEDRFYDMDVGSIDKDKPSYFYLSDNLFSFFDNNNLFIVDISNEVKVVRKINLFFDLKKDFIKDISYHKTIDNKENLYISFGKKGKQILLKDNKLIEGEKEGNIIHGIIAD